MYNQIKNRFSLLALLLVGLASLTQAQSNLPVLRFLEISSNVTIRGLEYSPRLLELNNKKIEMVGYMAPPLKPRLEFFVLTKTPMATCPFCSSAADWPPDIVLVYLPKNTDQRASSAPLRVTGRLELGVKEDQETGFISLIRIYADKVEAAR
jgi:hypothetical protein